MQQRKEPTRSHDMEEPQQQKEDTDVELNDEDNDERIEHAKWQHAADGEPRERLGNGWFPCSGYNGIACNILAQLSANEERCKECNMKLHENPLGQHCKVLKRLQNPHGQNRKDLKRAGQPNLDKIRKRVEQERLDAPNSVTTNHELKCLEACRSVAVTLCLLGEPGFHHILHGDEAVKSSPKAQGQWWTLLLRLARCADHTLIKTTLRKHSSHCGALAPDFNVKLFPLKGTPDCADAGNDTYSKVVAKLIFMCEKDIRKASDDITQQILHLEELNREHRGDVIECARGAAMYAHAVENGIPFNNYSMLQGGTWAHSDLPT